ncbi:hypothetical protein ES703_100936 [subsurface metagenome]
MASINLISNLGEDAKLEEIASFNHTVAWFLHEAFEKKGVEARFVKEIDLLEKSPPEADHSLVISNTAMYFVAGTHKLVRGKTPTIRSKIRKATKEKTNIYIDSDYPQWIRYFDYVFTVVKPRSTKPKCVYAGWGADPDLFYPEKAEKALFLDTNPPKPKFQRIYDIYAKVIPSTGMKVYQARRPDNLSWAEIREYFRKSHYYCDTRPGESSLTRIEAAISGALLVTPKPFYFPRSVGSLEYVLWDTEEELIDALNTDTDPQKIREKALEHSWDKVASRIIKTLNM